MMKVRRAGVVLILTLLVLAALVLIGTGLLFVSAQAARIGGAREQSLRVRLAAESAARAAVGAWRTSAYRGLAVGERRTALGVDGVPQGGIRRRATVERLAGPRYLIRAEASADHPGGARRRVGFLVRVLDPREAWADLPAPLSAAGRVLLTATARIDGTDPAAPPPPWPAGACPAEVAWELRALFGAGDRPGVRVVARDRVRASPGATVRGRPPVSAAPGLADPAAFRGLGALDPGDMRAVADRVASGTLRPRPAYDGAGECDTSAPGNWGAPLDPTGACGDYFPLVFAPGDLTLAGGAGQGVLVVEGDLVLTDDARFYGIVIVRGRLITADGTAIYGSVRAGGRSGPSEIGGTVAYRGCALWRALSESPALNDPFRTKGRSWIPLF